MTRSTRARRCPTRVRASLAAAATLSLLLLGCGSSSPTAPEAPADWASLEGGCDGESTFLAPPEVRPVPLGGGTDSGIDSYQGAQRTIVTDLGWYASSVSEYDGAPEHREWTERIDGRETRLVTCRDGRDDLAAASFAEVEPGVPPTRFFMLVRSGDPTARDEGLISIRSLDFR